MVGSHSDKLGLLGTEHASQFLGILSHQETWDKTLISLSILSPFSSVLNEANTSSTISCDSPLGLRQDEEQEFDPQPGCQEPTTGHQEVEESFL